MTKKEKKLVWVAAFLIMFFISLPNILGELQKLPETSFQGIFFDPQDYAVHVSMIRAGMQGDWAYQFRFTTEVHQGGHTRLFYVLLGQANRLLGFSPRQVFSFARWLFGLWALIALYGFIARLVEPLFWRAVAFWLVIFSAGLGWLQILFGWSLGAITPVDLWFVDAYVFFCLALFPHFSFVIGALAVSLRFYIDFMESGHWLFLLPIFVLALGAQLVNPIAFLLADLFFFIFTLAYFWQKSAFDKKPIFALGLLALIQLPLLFYNLNLLTADPVWSGFTRQNQLPSPPFVYYLWGFGFLWFFALIALFSAFSQRKPALIASFFWIFSAFILAYLPLNVERRFLFGITIPFTVLVVNGLRVIDEKIMLPTQKKRLLLMLVLSLLSMSSFSVILGYPVYMQQNPANFYYPSSLDAVFDWMNENLPPNDFVLGVPASGLLIAQETDLRVYVGHEMETLDYLAKEEKAERFYQDEGNLSGFKTAGVKWIFYGPYEKRLAAAFSPELPLVYDKNGIRIYKISDER